MRNKKVITMLFAMALAVFIPCSNVYAYVNNNVTTSDAIKIENHNNQKDLIDIENLQEALIELKEGESIEVPLQIYSGQGKEARGSVVDMGNAGTITFTRKADYVTYAMNITKLYNKISANVEVVDNYSGITQSTSSISSARGKISYKAVKTHQFSLSIDGYAYLFGEPVVSIYAQIFWMN
ncbi:hypothetical protein ACQPUR_23825 [Clostridium neonatale]|uniref:hypothetical protein n=1 Tax=Clostridium neonatale TaxID=137838 RepID=UPI003D34B77F